MRIVATSDTHFAFSPDQIPDGDVFIHGGDLMYDGTASEWHERVESLRALPHKHKLYIPGNHDFHVELYQGIALAELRRAGVRVLGLTERSLSAEIMGKKILGLPWVANLPGWAFNRDETWIRDYMNNVATPLAADVIVSHAPMFNVLDAVLPEMTEHRAQTHVGCLAYNYWYWQDGQPRPKVWINGHIHESYGRHLEADTAFYNVAMCDRDYKQTNPPMVIDLD